MSGSANSWRRVAWLATMAWRDSRASRARLFFFSMSIVLGAAALVAVRSLGSNLKRNVDEQAKSLVGADLVIRSRHAFSSEEEQFLQSLGGRQAREISFSSMISFPALEAGRLVQVRAVQDPYPFYGEMEAAPPEATARLKRGDGVLLEETLLSLFDVAPGDPVQIGSLSLPIVGSLRKVPGESVMFSTIAPRVYLPWDKLPQTGLLREGSLARYKVYFKFGPEVSVSNLVRRIRPRLDEYRLDFDTVEKRKANLGRSMNHLQHFLNLIAFVAVILGAVGIASALQTHVKEKLATVAVLRCLGAGAWQTFSIYLLQGVALGAAGIAAGVALGAGVQWLLPSVLRDFVPFEIVTSFSWTAAMQAAAIGLTLCCLFVLGPLLPVRRVPPITVLRAVSERGKRDWLLCACYLSAAGVIVAFSIAQSGKWQHGLSFAAAVGAVFALLAGSAKLLSFAASKLVPGSWPFVWRQGLANLHRPNNRTHLMMVTLGLATFLMASLYLTKDVLLRELLPDRGANQPNTALFDIQTDQNQPVADLVRAHGVPVITQAPIVTMRLSSVKGRDVAELLKDKQRQIPGWALRREYRSTYRDALTDTETTVAGAWPLRIEGGVAAVSLEKEIAQELNVGLGDSLVFDVQGIPVPARVAHLREVDWRQLQPNFFVVFPSGVLEEAPAFHVLTTRVPSSARSALLQRALLKHFPNVSIIDLRLILQTLDTVFDKIGFAITFMSLFTLGTGLLVLISVIIVGRYQRAQESMLLRTLGASRRQVRHILLAEYLFLGTLGSLAGMVLAIPASWALLVQFFKVGFHLAWTPLLATWAGVCLVTITTGLLASRGSGNHPLLPALRQEN